MPVLVNFSGILPDFDDELRQGCLGAGCFALAVFLVSCRGQYSVALLRGAVGWFALYDCDIS